jgi:hypothetical protein
MPWHPPALCWAYRWLDVQTIETIAAKIFNKGFEEWELDRQVLTWEGEGGKTQFSNLNQTKSTRSCLWH